MAKKHNNYSYITYDDLEKLGFGSWLKKNAGTIGMITGGVAGTLIAPGIGTQIGASLGGALGGSVQAADAENRQNQQAQFANEQIAARTAAMSEFNRDVNNSKSVPQLFENGGLINYQGQTHEGPDGGIPVDELGNPVSKSGNQPVALVENGEVAYTGKDFGTYVFSNNLKYDKNQTFAQKAKSIQRKYKLRMNKDGDITDPIAKTAYDKEMQSLIEQQEAHREHYGVNKEELINKQLEQIGLPIKDNKLPIGKDGIYIKPSKRGTFTEAAKKHGMSVQEFAKHVLANKEDYSPEMVKKANFARNAASWKKEAGGVLPTFDGGGTIGFGEAMLPAIAAHVGNSLLSHYIKKQPLPYIKPQTVVAPTISLSTERTSARENAIAAEANARRNLLLSGASQNQFLIDTTNASLGVQRNLGEQLAKSYSTEAAANAEARAKADALNAEYRNKADLYNSNLDLDRLKNLIALRASTYNAYASALSDYVKGRADYRTLQMKNPDITVKEQSKNRFLGFLFPNLSITKK